MAIKSAREIALIRERILSPNRHEMR